MKVDSTATTIAVAGVLAIPVGAAMRAARRHHVYGTPTERAAYEAMHTVSLAAPVLREGLSPESARKSARHLRRLLGTAAVAITDADRLLAWDGEGDRHAEDALVHAKNVITTGRVKLLDWVDCGSEDCQIRDAVIAPLIVDGQTVGTLAAYNATASVALTPGRVRGRPLGLVPAGTRPARPVAYAGHGGRDPSAARADLAALHLQLAHGYRVLRTHRPVTCP